MAVPQIQYAKTSDGVSIAFMDLGEGTPLVFVSNIWGNAHIYTSGTPFGRAWTDELVAAGFRCIRYDGRGTGSSDRDAVDFSLEACLRDLEAVVQSLDLGGFDLIASGHGGPTAIAYTVQHPERVSHLMLRDTAASGRELHAAEVRLVNVIQTGSQAEWKYFTLILGNQFIKYKDSEAGRKLGEALRAGMTVQAFIACEESFERIDVTALLDSVSVPVLVVHDSGSPSAHMKVAAQQLARRIPNARFVSTDDWVRAFREFVGEERDGASDEPAPSGTAVILFADIADSTALTEKLGDAAFRDKARELDEALRGAISANGGTAIDGKLLGDGVLATFGAAREAIACAMAIHRMAGSGVPSLRSGQALGQGSSPDDPLLLHIGIHAGDVIRESNNVYGGAVNIASRVANEAGAGETLVSATVRDLARTSAGVSFEDRGERELKGVGEPVRVYEVRWQA
jgi:class 3 adenylate cyclase/pimeloyl-ACP methyl ester carboxylesterase